MAGSSNGALGGLLAACVMPRRRELPVFLKIVVESQARTCVEIPVRFP